VEDEIMVSRVLPVVVAVVALEDLELRRDMLLFPARLTQ
jgi:hypothetical protein